MKVDQSKCLYCGGCVGVCPVNALELYETRIRIDLGKCTRCGICIKFCPVGAISGDKK